MLYQTLYKSKSDIPGTDSAQASPKRLPEPWKTCAEAVSQLNLDDVRVYYDSPRPLEYGALAYARKNEIHMGPGAAAHVPHELWHIVQQRQGRVAAQGTNPPANEDRALEAEANAFEKGLLRSDTIPAFPAGSSFSSESVQYLKPLRTLSYLRSPNVQAALREYHTFCDSFPDANLMTRNFPNDLDQRLAAVRDACEEGSSLHANLLAQVEREQEICSRLRAFWDKADRLAALLSEEDAGFEDYVQNLSYAGKIYENYEDCKIPIIQRLYAAAKQIVEAPDTIPQEEVTIRLHVARFHKIQEDPNAPVELKDVLNQILPLTDNIPVKYGSDGKQTSLMKPERGPFLPRRPYGPAGTGGIHSDLEISSQRRKETLDTAHGGFLHELTHAAVQRTFHNTPLHLGVRAIPLNDANEDQIRLEYEQVLGYRSLTAMRLNQLIQAERANSHSPFSKWQLDELSDKFEYGTGQPWLSQYICFLAKIPATKAPALMPADEGTLLVNTIQPLLVRLQQLQQPAQPQQPDFKIDSSIFMEYDTTINQMLLWCYDWEIPQDNPVYRELAAAAKTETLRRNRELNSNVLASMNHSYPQSETGISNVTFNAMAGDEIKISFESDIENGELNIILYDSQHNAVYQLDHASLSIPFTVGRTDTYTMAAEYIDFVGNFRLIVRKS